MNSSSHGDAPRSRRRGAMSARLASGAALLLFAPATWAQDQLPSEAAKQAAASDEADGTIVVTASRTDRSGYNAPTPTTVLGAELIEQRAATNIANVLNEVPAFRASTSPGTNIARSANPGAYYADLRGLGSQRTLVLVNGRRFVPTAPSSTVAATGQVDLNQIPTILIDRAEIVTGGASAQWGSDAVAGVVNLILKDRFSGLQLEAQGGLAEAGDYEEFRLGGLGGTDFAGGRGHIVIAGEFVRNYGADDYYSRSFGKQEWGVVSNTASGTNGLPARILSQDVHLASMTLGGLVTAGPLRGTQFLADGSPAQFTFGQFAGALNMIGGDNEGVTFQRNVDLAPPITRGNLYSHAEYEFSDSLSGFVEVNYAYSKVDSEGVPPKDQGSIVQNPVQSAANMIVIRDDNVFLPEATRIAMADAGVSYINMGRWSDDMGLPQIRIVNKTIRGTAGLKGQLGSDWNWDFYYQYGRNRYRQDLSNLRIEANFRNAIDAVADPLTGDPICRSTLSDPGNGCQPMNLFGIGNWSQASHDYVFGEGWSVTTYQQHVAAANLRGKPFSTWAGPVSIAAGIEYRKEIEHTDVDSLSLVNAFNLGNPKPIHGSFDVKEGYLEVVVPLASGSAFADSLELNGAVRYADYSSIGDAVTWKVGATWAPIPALRFRVNKSHDVRAPNISELYSMPVGVQSTVTDPLRGNGSFIVPVSTQGNLNLDAETADTFTAGVVVAPTRGLRFSIDYFNIDLEGAISTLTLQTIVNRCAAGDASLCQFVTRDPTSNAITQVVQTQINLASIKTRGFDFEASYRTALGQGDLSLNLLGTYVDKLVVDDTLTVVDRAGELGPNNPYTAPHFRGSANLNYSIGRFSVNTQVSFIGSGKYDNTFDNSAINDNSIPSRAYVTLGGQVDLMRDRRLQLFGVVNNLFDQDPPPAPANAILFPTNAVYYDILGRRYTMGVRARF